MNKALTCKEAAKRLNINSSRVRQLILAGRLPATKFGRDWVIQEKDLALVAIRKHGRPFKIKSPIHLGTISKKEKVIKPVFGKQSLLQSTKG